MILSKSKAPKDIKFPDNFICNVPINHTPLDKGHKRDRCYCQNCIKKELDPSVYTYGKAIPCHPSFDHFKEEFVGVYLKINEPSDCRREQEEETAQAPR